MDYKPWFYKASDWSKFDTIRSDDGYRCFLRVQAGITWWVTHVCNEEIATRNLMCAEFTGLLFRDEHRANTTEALRSNIPNKD